MTHKHEWQFIEDLRPTKECDCELKPQVTFGPSPVIWHLRSKPEHYKDWRLFGCHCGKEKKVDVKKL